MPNDTIVDEIRRIRDAHAKQFNYDLHAICADFRAKQQTSGHQVVTRNPKEPQMRVRGMKLAVTN